MINEKNEKIQNLLKNLIFHYGFFNINNIYLI